MKFIATRSFLRVPSIQAAIPPIDGSPHPLEVPKGVVFQLGAGNTLEELSAEPEIQKLAAALIFTEAIADVTDPKTEETLTQRIRAEIAAEEKALARRGELAGQFAALPRG
jgi:hypothetical protein